MRETIAVKSCLLDDSVEQFMLICEAEFTIALEAMVPS
jgi:hypothetical protein